MRSGLEIERASEGWLIMILVARKRMELKDAKMYGRATMSD